MPDRGIGLEDALGARVAGSTEGMTLQVLAQIRDSLSAMNRDITAIHRDMKESNEATADVRERVIRLEERDRRLDDLEGAQAEHAEKIAALMKDKDRRDGAGSFLGGMFKYGPAIFSLLTVLYLFGRSLGVVPAPPAPVTVPTPMQIERRQQAEEGVKP